MFQVFFIRKVQILETTPVAVNAISQMKCIITHKISHIGQ